VYFHTNTQWWSNITVTEANRDSALKAEFSSEKFHLLACVSHVFSIHVHKPQNARQVNLLLVSKCYMMKQQ